MTTKEAVIFDLDGVLVDSEPVLAFAATHLFRDFGITVSDRDFLPFVGTGEDNYIGGVAKKYGLDLNLKKAKRRLYEIYLEYVPRYLKPFDGAAELMKACKEAGLKVAIATSADQVKVDANLNKIGLPSGVWDSIVVGDSVEAKKPAPDLFLQVARELCIDPSVCVVIEDSINGIVAAKAANMKCVALAHSFPKEALQQADVVKKSISELTLEEVLS